MKSIPYGAVKMRYLKSGGCIPVNKREAVKATALLKSKSQEGQCYRCGEIRQVKFSPVATQERRLCGLSLKVYLCKGCEKKLDRRPR